MSEIIDPLKKQAVYAEGKLDFVNGEHHGYNPYCMSSEHLGHRGEFAKVINSGVD